MSNFTWLFGENLGETADNNSFHLWLEAVNKKDGIDKTNKGKTDRGWA